MCVIAGIACIRQSPHQPSLQRVQHFGHYYSHSNVRACFLQLSELKYNRINYASNPMCL